MKKLPKYLGFIVLALLLCFNLTSCKEEEVILTVDQALTSSKSGSNVKMEGIVYFSTDDGYYLTSNNSFIYVEKNKLSNNYQIGEKIEVDGYYSFFQSQPKIVNTKSMSLVSTGNVFNNPEAIMLFELLNTSSSDSTMYSKYIKLKGKLSKNSDGVFYITDLLGYKINLDKTDLDSFLNKNVSFDCIVTGYNENWEICVTSSLTITDYTQDEIIKYAIKDLEGRIPTDIYDVYTKPTSNLSGVTYILKFKIDNKIQSEKYTRPTTDKENSKLILSVIYNNETYSDVKEYSVNLWADKVRSVAFYNEHTPFFDKSFVKITGAISSVLYNSTSSYQMVVVKDLDTSDTAMVTKWLDPSDVDNVNTITGKFLSLKIGDYVTIGAKYGYSNSSYDFKKCLYLEESSKTIIQINELEEGKTIDYSIDKESAKIINSSTTYSEVCTNYQDYIGKLICLKDQYYCYSGSAGTVSNWVIPLYTADRTSIYESTLNSSGNRKKIGLSINANDKVYGDSSWRTSFEIPNNNYDYEKIGCDIYGYLIPSTNSSEYIQFVISSYEGLDLNLETKINNSLKANTKANIFSNENLTLCSEVNGISINWKSSDVNIQNNIAEIALSENSKVINLTAEYSIDSINKKTIQIPIYLCGEEEANITNILNYDNNYSVYGVGVIIAYGSETLSSSYRDETEITNNESLTYRANKGFIVKDLSNNSLVFVNYVEYYLDQNYPNYEHQLSSYTASHDAEESWGYFTDTDDEIEYTIGSVIEFKGIFNKEYSSVNIKDGYLDYVREANENELSILNGDITTVNNQTDLSEAIYDINTQDCSTSINYMKVIKLVGDDENLIYFTPTSSNEGSANKINFRIHYNSEARASKETGFDGCSLVIKQDNQYVNTHDDEGNSLYQYDSLDGELWYQELGLPDIGVANNMYPGYGFTGEMYLVIVYNSSSSDGINCFYYSSSIVQYGDWELELVYNPNSIEQD